MRTLATIWGLVLLLNAFAAAAQPPEATAVCTQHLQAISRALAAFKRDHGEWPANLSDLYPNYVSDKEVFRCPADPSPGSPGSTEFDDPKLPVSYDYFMGTGTYPRAWYPQLGPQRLPPGRHMRDYLIDQRNQLGDHVPVAFCRHHMKAGGHMLILTWSGKVYSAEPDIWTKPWAISGMLERMEQDLTAGAPQFVRNWFLPAVVDYSSRWIHSSLSPTIRCSLGTVAQRLSTMAAKLPTDTQSAAHYVAALYYDGAGQPNKAIAICEAALRPRCDVRTDENYGAASPANQQGYRNHLAGLLALLRYRGRVLRGKASVDDYLSAQMAWQRIPGLVVGVVRNGNLVFSKGYGVANVAPAIPVTKDTVFPLLSITKTFTATAIMLLVEQGKLSLDDHISQCIPSIPIPWKEITVRHLLSHMSGIKDYWNEVPYSEQRKDATPDSIIQEMAQSPLHFSPGERQNYSNTNFVILGRIIEKVTGKPYKQFLDEMIFLPLHMDILPFSVPPPDHAMGYALQGNAWKQTDEDIDHYYAGGGLRSRLSDMVKWDAALYTERLLKRSTLEQMWTPATLKDGTRGWYGLGWFANNDPDHKTVAHYGNSPGFDSELIRYVSDKVTVIVFANIGEGYYSGLGAGIAAYFLPAPKPIQDKDPQTTQRLKHVLLGLSNAKGDPALWTPEAFSALSAERKSAGAFYRSLGQLKSFQLIEETSQGMTRTYRYRALFGKTAWIEIFNLTGEGKITDLGVAME